MNHISFNTDRGRINLDRDINVYLKDGKKIEVSKIVRSMNGAQIDSMKDSIKRTSSFELEYYDLKKADIVTIEIITDTISQFQVGSYNIIN